MAECNLTSLIVSGPVDPSRNSLLGTYQANGTTSAGGSTFTRWILNGDANYRIDATVITGGPDVGKLAWSIRAPIGPPFPVAQYSSEAKNIGEFPDCPLSSNITWNTSTAPAPVPTISSGASPTPSISPQQRRIINLRKQLKLGDRKNITLK
jgi:hypothetical protein